jgi:hypothetical protein
VDGAPALTFAQLVHHAPTPPTSYLAEVIMARVIRSELEAGRVLEHNGGYQLNPEHWDPGQLAALRELEA